jgi:hypothetical protein
MAKRQARIDYPAPTQANNNETETRVRSNVAAHAFSAYARKSTTKWQQRFVPTSNNSVVVHLEYDWQIHIFTSFSRCKWDMQVKTCCNLHGLGVRMQTPVNAEVRGFVPVGHAFQRRCRCRGPRRFLRASANGRLSIVPRTNRSGINYKRNTWKSCQSNGGATHGNMNFNISRLACGVDLSKKPATIT